MSATTAPDSPQTGAERRRDQRYDVKLPGALGVDGEVISVTIGDLSGSGALLLLDTPPDEGAIADLWIEGFGDLEVKIMFSGDGMCGVMFTRPAEHRDRLLKWLMQRLATAEDRAVIALEAVSLAPALAGGAAVGSFLGVIAARVPPLLFENDAGRVSPRRLVSALSSPASRCDHCQAAIAWHDNIPVLSWLVLRGRCRACGHGFGAASLLLELAAAAAAAASVHLFGWSLEGGLCFLLLTLLLALTAIDLKEMLLPDVLVLPLLPAGLVFQALYGDGLVSGLVGAAVAFAILWAIGAGYGLARKAEGMGGGDIKLAGALGAWLGIAKIPFFLLGAFAGGVLVMGLVLALSRRDARAHLPFGPFLAASAAILVLVPQAATTVAGLLAY